MEMYFSIKIYTLTQGRLARITASIIKKKNTQAKALKSIHKEKERERMDFDMFLCLYEEILCLAQKKQKHQQQHKI